MTIPVASRNWGSQEGPRARDLTVAQQGTAGATNKLMTRQIVADLITHGGMTTDYSCNSVTAGTKGDGVNRWVADSDIVGNTPGSAHSWYVGILHAGSLGSICIDKDSSSDGGGGAPGSVYWSPAAGFTGGTTTARPTATDEQEITTSTQMWNTTNGSYTYHIWRCDTVGQEAVRFATIHSSNTAGPDNIFCVEKAESTPTAWSPPIVATFRSGGAASVADRGNWIAVGWKARVAGTNRTPTLVGDTPPTTTDVDGDVLLVPVGLNDATIGRLGFIADWHMVQDGATNLSTFSDADGLRGWIVLDEIVWPWDRSATAGGNVAGAKLLVNFLPAEDSAAPVVTGLSPAAGTPISRNQVLTFDAVDESGFSKLLVFASFDTKPRQTVEMVYDGDGFRGNYTDSNNVVTEISSAHFRFQVLRIGGWPSAPRLEYIFIDSDGSVAEIA